MSLGTEPEIDTLQAISARIGGQPLLVQAATGNTSIKLDGVLWIKASGRWLAHAATEDIMIPVDLEETRRKISLHIDPAGQSTVHNGRALGTSVETAMHAVLPWRAVLHVHSVNTIAWAVRRDGERELQGLLEGLDWKWIPYVSSGLPLARAIEDALLEAPRTKVLVLANHGLVVCGEDCEGADTLLTEIERRVYIEPRSAPIPDRTVLERIAATELWEVPRPDIAHSLATDPVARRIVTSGILYPCQTIFLTPHAKIVPASVSASELASLDEPFVLIEDCGVLVRPNPNPAAAATLEGLAQVVQRIPASAPIRYLREDEARELLSANIYHYRSVVEGYSFSPGTRTPVTSF